MTILEARGISKTYTVDRQKITVLDNVSLSVEDGESLVIEGESGSGKSTLLSIISGLILMPIGALDDAEGLLGLIFGKLPVTEVPIFKKLLEKSGEMTSRICAIGATSLTPRT